MSEATTWARPLESFAAPPRAVRLRSFPVGAILIFLVMGGAGLGMCTCEVVPLTLGLAARGIGDTVPGEVTAKTLRGRRGLDRLVAFAYAVDDQEFRAEINVDAAAYDRLKVGDAVEVRVLPLCPGISAWIVPDVTPAWNALAFSGFAIAWNVIMALILAGFFSKARLRRRLARLGTPCLGAITSKEVAAGKHPTYRLTYRYRAADGSDHDATIDVAAKDYEAATIGQPVTVLHDPTDPQTSVIHALSEYEVTR